MLTQALGVSGLWTVMHELDRKEVRYSKSLKSIRNVFTFVFVQFFVGHKSDNKLHSILCGSHGIE